MVEERVTLLAGEPIEIAEVRVPREHIRRDHGEALYVLAGELCFSVDDRELGVGPDTWVLVPPNIASTAVATGSDGARFLELGVPREAGSVVVRHRADSEAVEISGNRIAFLADAHETGGALGAIEFSAPRAFAGPPPHLHRGFHDIVYVLEGTIEIVLGAESSTAGPGALVHAPPGVVHTFSNPSDAPLRFLNLYVPGGFERFFRERAAASAAGAELTSRYDWERA